MGVAYIHSPPPPPGGYKIEILMNSWLFPVTFFYNVYHKWHQDNSSGGHDDFFKYSQFTLKQTH